MFESAEIGHAVDRETWRREVPPLREALLDAQAELHEKKRFPVVILIGGVDGAGKGETANLLHEWLDPRHIQSHAMGAPSDEERERPPMWRFWRALPPRGKIGLFFGSWYTMPIVSRVYGETRDAELDASIQEILRFEKMLADEGVLLLKFWLHLSKKDQKKRLEKLAADKRTRWRVTDTDWKHFDLYDRFRRISARALRQTSTGDAPWMVVEGADARYRSLTVGRALLEALQRRLAADPPRRSPAVAALPAPADGARLLDRVDLSKKLDDEEYDERLDRAQRRLNLLSREPRFHKRALVAVFEGWDAAGKGGAIRRLTAALDARYHRVIPIAAPTEEERAQPYLWRFWRHLPRRGHFALFDRSWYGRVLVERIEGFCSEADWSRAYGEINDFEEQMHRHKIAVVKFWLHISPEEQLRRFEERQATGWKRFKITDEDWRNRAKWDAYLGAASEMIERTSTRV